MSLQKRGMKTTGKGEKGGGENRLDSRILVSKWEKVVRGGWGEKEVRVNQGHQGPHPNQ